MRDAALRAALGMGDKGKANILIIVCIYLFMLVSNFVSCVTSVSDWEIHERKPVNFLAR